MIYFRIGLIMLTSLLIAGCHKKEDKKGKETVSPPVRVEVEVIGLSQIEGGREYSGTVAASEQTIVSFAVAGTITDLYGKEGQKIKKGELLGKVRSGDYQNAYNIAEAQLVEAQDGYNRLKKLHDANALPEVKWVEMEQKLKQARNAVEMAERTLKDANLYSPVSGTITKKTADVGQTVLPVQPVYEIVSTERLEIDVYLSENEIDHIKEGQKANIWFESAGLQPMEGKVIRKAISADALTRSYEVKLSIEGNQDGKILAGMLANVKFDKPEEPGGEKDSAIVTLPSGSVLLDSDNRWFVWIVKNQKAERRFVEVNELVSNGILVKSGLMPGDSVIVAGMQKIGTGSEIIPLVK